MKIRVAIVGLGNCASSLIQGIYKYKKNKKLEGILNKQIGKYSVNDIDIVAAFDIDKRKVGLDISKAIFSLPNNTKIFYKNIPNLGIKVMRGKTLDGNSLHMSKYDKKIRFVESKSEPIDITKELIKSKTDILICYLPVGSEEAARFYAKCCLEAKVNFINAMPVFICSDKLWAKKFKEKKLVCAGDDIKAQIGATIVHRTLVKLFEDRGVKINNTYQLNFGGNTDFLNMLDRDRLKSKKISKTEAVQSQLKTKLNENNIHVGPSDFVPFLKDNKICFIKILGEEFGGTEVELDVKLSVEDSPNSAGVMIDVIRCVKAAHDKGLSGVLKDVSAFCFKHPPIQYDDFTCKKKINKFIEEMK